MNGEEPIASNGGQLRELIRGAEQEVQSGASAEYRKLFLALGRIASHLESERATLGRLITRVEKHERMLMGDENKPGLREVLDRMVSDQKAADKKRLMILSSVIGLIVLRLGELLLRHP